MSVMCNDFCFKMQNIGTMHKKFDCIDIVIGHTGVDMTIGGGGIRSMRGPESGEGVGMGQVFGWTGQKKVYSQSFLI